MQERDLQIKNIKIEKIKPYENNAKIHTEKQINQIMESIKDFGFNDPLGVDEHGVIIEGHGRYEAAKRLGMQTVPVVIIKGLTEQQKIAYALVHNKLTMDTDFDLEILSEELKKIDTDDFDFSVFDFDVDYNINIDVDENENKNADEIPAIDEKEPSTKMGDIFQLGNHKLMCGDSTDRKQVEKLMNGEKADMVFTDPPYNVAIGKKNRFLNSIQRCGRCLEDIIEDQGKTDEEIGEELWKPAFINMRDASKDCCSIYVTMPQGGSHMMMMMMMSAAWQVKHELIWVKSQPTFSMGRLDYDYQHEPICYGWKKSHNFYGEGDFTKSIWQFDKPKQSKLHPTMKPVELIENALKNSSKKNDLIIDFFGGSGSTLIACEKLNRKCFMMELSPKYCDVIIKRWEDYTGKKAIKIN